MIVTRAPLRIPLAGGGTDLPSYYRRYGSFLLTAAINKYIYVALHTAPLDNLIRLKYSEMETVQRVGDIRHRIFREALGLLNVNHGVEIATFADVPAGTGLGTSGSFTAALLAALHAYKKENASPQELAEEAFSVEMAQAGLPVGKQDQYAAAFGGLVSLTIDQGGATRVQALNLGPEILRAFQARALVFFTGQARRSADILSQQVAATEQGQEAVIQSLHRTQELAHRIHAVLQAGDLDEFGRLLHEHWMNKKGRSGSISSPQIDRWYSLALAEGALGGKIMGAGGAGFFLLCCREGSADRVRAALEREGLRELSYEFSPTGAEVMLDG
ncbi:MAG: hypothetical protein HY686_00105 [Chloroflexi bacterium]|nr:hypothetical protein [Chloroflexota bacterium]